MVNKKSKKTSKRAPKKQLRKTTPRSPKKTASKPVVKNPEKVAAIMNVQLSRSVLPALVIKENRIFSIEVGSISGDTTIGDLIVAFPRTRDVLMKHGLRFDVEQAGYLYMTLNVFSAIHGVASNNLIQEIHTASKESPEPPTQTVRPITVPQTP